MERKIVGAIISGGKLYKAGDEDAYAAHMQGRDLSGLIERGELTGNWSADADPDAKKPSKKSTGKGE